MAEARGWIPQGVECPPAELGVDPDRLARVPALAAARGVTAQLCVLRHGRVLIDRTFGCRPDALFLLFSAGKPFVAVLAHLLAERGVLALDAPVARYWPEFARHGKEGITVRQVLQHRAGLPVARGVAADVLVAPSWRCSVRAIAAARPASAPGQLPAYHILGFGFILGEVIRRATGTELVDVLRAELLDPLGLADTHLGLPDALWPRHVPIRSRGTDGWVRALLFNRRAVRRAVIPAATVSSTARDLVRFYQLLLAGGQLDGTRLLSPGTVAAATTPSSDGELDRFLHLPVRWSQGFQLGGPATVPGATGRVRPMGRLSNADTFGHNGSNCCLGWADPHRQLVFAYLTDRLDRGLEGSPHLAEVSDAVLAACH